MFTGVPARSVALRVRCPGRLGCCSPMCPLSVLFFLCGVLGHLAPAHRCACSVRCLCVRCPGPLGSCSPVCPLGVLCCMCCVLGHLSPIHQCAPSVCCVACAASWATWLLLTGVPARCVVLRVRCPGPLGSCSPVCSPGVLCGGLSHLAPVHRCAPSVCCAVGCVCGASLRGAHSSIRTVAFRSRQGLGTLRARTRLSGRRLFVAGRGWVPSGRTRVHLDGGCSVAAGARFAAGRAHVCPDGGWCCLAPVLVLWFVACCARSPGLRRPAAVAAWHPSVCLGCGRRRASLACLVAARGVPRLVRSGRSRCSGRLSRRRGAFPHPGGLRPQLYWAAARGTPRLAENWAHCACPWPLPRQGRWACSASYPFGAPRWDSPWRVPPASVLGCVRCAGWRVWTRSLTRPPSRTVCRSTGDSAGAPGLFHVDADTSPCGSEDFTPGSRACVRVLALLGRVGQAGLPGAFWCASPFPLAALSFCFARPPPGWACPRLGPLFALPFPSCFFFPFSVVVFLAPPLSPAVSGFRPREPWAWALCVVCFVGLALLGSPCALVSLVSPGRWLLSGGGLPPPFCLSLVLPPLGAWLSFFFLPLCAPVVSVFLWFRAPAALGLGAVFCLFCGPPAARLSVRSCLACVTCLAVGCFLLVATPPPFVSRGFLRCRSVLLSFFYSCVVRPCCLWLSLVSGPGCPGPWRCALFSLLAFSALCALSPLSCFPPGRWLLPGGSCPPPPLCFAVFVAAARCCVPCAVLCCVSRGALLRHAAARCAARCCAVVCCVALLRSFGAAACCAVPSGAARRPGALCSAALCFAVFPRAVCSVLCVFCRGVVVRAVVRCSALCCVCPGVPVLCALCGAVLRCAGALALCFSCGACCCWRLVLWWAAVCCAVSFGVLWCGAPSGGPWLSAGGGFRCRCPRLAASSASLWLVWFAVVPCFPESCSVVLCCRVVPCRRALLSCCGAVGACFALLWPVVLCCVVLLVGCTILCPVVVSACCGALSLVLCVPCLLRSVRCCALLCWLWCPASLCHVLWRCAVAWCCAVVLCRCFAVLFVLALPSCGLSCGAVESCVVLLVVCAVFCLVVAFVCCGAPSLPAGTHATIPHTEENQPALFIQFFASLLLCFARLLTPLDTCSKNGGQTRRGRRRNMEGKKGREGARGGT